MVATALNVNQSHSFQRVSGRGVEPFVLARQVAGSMIEQHNTTYCQSFVVYGGVSEEPGIVWQRAQRCGLSMIFLNSQGRDGQSNIGK